MTEQVSEEEESALKERMLSMRRILMSLSWKTPIGEIDQGSQNGKRVPVNLLRILGEQLGF